MRDKRLKPCPFCGGACSTVQGEAVEQVWQYGKFWRAFCTRCQARQLFHKSEAEAVSAWNRRAIHDTAHRIEGEEN